MNTVTIKLTAYQAHNLLSDLESKLRVCNRDNSQTEKLYMCIAEQMNCQFNEQQEPHDPDEIDDLGIKG